ncbi:MAG: hypothetical protein ABL901_03245 [Hyphomicrobiaceae bacterium]
MLVITRNTPRIAEPVTASADCDDGSDGNYREENRPPLRTKHNLIDGRSIGRTERFMQINIRATIETVSLIKRLVVRDGLPSIAVLLELALADYQAAHPERTNIAK